jgi:Protein of unknown function (DUF3047)
MKKLSKKNMALILPAILMLTAVLAGAMPKELRLTFDNLAAWQEKSFKGHTTYSPEKFEGRTVVRAKSSGTASGLYHNVVVNSSELPVIKWSWKIKNTLPAENPYRKDGDDFAARVYVVFPGRFFWQTRALVYVWSDKLPVGTTVSSSFTSNAAIIAVETGNRLAGTWRNESRNYVEDYRAAFRTSPADPEAVAIMTDCDNTGSEAIAWYGDITFAR